MVEEVFENLLSQRAPSFVGGALHVAWFGLAIATRVPAWKTPISRANRGGERTNLSTLPFDHRVGKVDLHRRSSKTGTIGEARRAWLREDIFVHVDHHFDHRHAIGGIVRSLDVY